MGKKIITVDLNFPSEIQTVEEIVNDPPPGDEYTAVKEEASASGGGVDAGTQEVESPPRAKPKRKPVPKKAIALEVEPVLEPPIDAGTQEVEEPKPKAEPLPLGREEAQKVKCHHCNKEMTMKSLKYSHSRNCLGLKKTIEKVSNEKVSQQVEVKPPTPVTPGVKTEKENPRTVRMNLLKERYNNLVKNAFN
jgi:hypothetical protein